VLPLIHDLSKPEEREFYTQKLARFLRIDERAFIGARAPTVAPRRSHAAGATEPGGPVQNVEAMAERASPRKVEIEILAWLFRKPELLYRVDRLLQQFGLATLSADDFEYTDHQVIFRLIREAVEQDGTEQHAYVVDSLPEALKGLSAELLAQTDQPDVLDKKLLDELLRAIRRMREQSASEKRTQYRFLQEEAQEKGDAESATLYQGEVLKLTQLKRVLDEFEHQMSLRRME
jgi:hypothetical protein